MNDDDDWDNNHMNDDDDWDNDGDSFLYERCSFLFPLNSGAGVNVSSLRVARRVSNGIGLFFTVNTGIRISLWYTGIPDFFFTGNHAIFF